MQIRNTPIHRASTPMTDQTGERNLVAMRRAGTPRHQDDGTEGQMEFLLLLLLV